ncbi:30S ribosome-binding factor RbfA [Prolixibacter sp. SD074]|jgi:ribosome-binding factor A|uniref:30S ribosome-binding factor RbfA n=1 Tax=Prolixibacter sp. SD074 TaxID=2652391 RepID=UPI0012750C09|nr:30S ribosome-binding factor RbfA [Prolixibacter sp. SD074]GET30573.1 ribosome-binding factor A [Prolixibacter sp. SD074]
MKEYSTRQNKIGRLIQKELSELFRRESQMLFRGKMITVTVVRVTRDMSLARCYLSIFPSENAQEILDNINDRKGHLRGELGRIVRHQLRVIPDLEFLLDDSLDYIENIDNLLK